MNENDLVEKEPVVQTKRAIKAKPRWIKHRRVFIGYINPKEPKELPISLSERMQIVFGNSRWDDFDKKCRITVEWE